MAPVQVYRHTCMHTYIHTYVHTYINCTTYIHAYVLTCIHADMHTCIHAYMHTYMHTCIHTCMHAYIHAYIHAYMHTCMHAYIHTHIPLGSTSFGLARNIAYSSYTYCPYGSGSRDHTLRLSRGTPKRDPESHNPMYLCSRYTAPANRQGRLLRVSP